MNNPYAPPKSNVEVHYQFKHSIGWKIYFALFALLTAFGFYYYLVMVDTGLAEYIGVLVSAIEMVGLFGFVYVKAIAKPQLWLWVMVLSITFFFGYEVITEVEDDMTRVEYMMSLAVGLLLYIPFYVALFKYAKPTYPAWKKAEL